MRWAGLSRRDPLRLVVRGRGSGHRPADEPGGGAADRQADQALGDRQPRQPQRHPRPARQRGHGRGGQTRVARPRGQRQRGSQQQEPGRLAGGRGAGQLGAVGLQGRLQLGDGHRRVEDPQPGRHDRGLGDVPVGLGGGQRPGTEPLVGDEEAVDLGDVDPAQQVGVARGVRPSVGGGPTDPLVDGADPGDDRLGVLDGAERGGREEGAGALQPAPRVALVARVGGHPGHGQRVQRLHEQRPDATDEHRGVGVDPPDHVVGVNHRSPGESQMTLARSAASSPATRLRSEEARVRRAEDSQRDGVERRGWPGKRRRTHPLQYDVPSPDARVRRRLPDAYLRADC